MNSVLENFYKGMASLYDLETELELWDNIVQEYEDNDVYSGDQYYQDALQTQSALKEAIDNFYEYYNEDGSFKENN